MANNPAEIVPIALPQFLNDEFVARQMELPPHEQAKACTDTNPQYRSAPEDVRKDYQQHVADFLDDPAGNPGDYRRAVLVAAGMRLIENAGFAAPAFSELQRKEPGA